MAVAAQEALPSGRRRVRVRWSAIKPAQRRGGEVSVITGHDAWKLEGPPETNGPERCWDCREELSALEAREGICRPCLNLRSEDDR
jgi:hypothetical protein